MYNEKNIFNDNNIVDAILKAMHPSIKDEYEKSVYISRFMGCLDDVYFYSEDTNLTPRETLELAFQIYGVRYRHPQSFKSSEDLANTVADAIEEIDLQNWALNVIKYNLT